MSLNYEKGLDTSDPKLGNLNQKNRLTICIAGKNAIAVNGLKLIKKNYSFHNICFLPNPTDDGVDNWQPSLKKFGNQLSLKEVKLEELYSIENLLFLSLEYSEIIKIDKFLSNKLFNIHFSLLPKFKGMFTSSLPLLYGEESSGVTLHEIDNGIDTGRIIDQIKFKLDDDDTARDLYFKYLDNSYLILQRNIEKLINNSYSSTPQSSINSSYFSKTALDYKNIQIDYNKTAFEVKNQFRAISFREYQLACFDGCNILKVEILNDRSILKPGNKLFENDIFFIISTIDYNLKLYKDYYNLFWDSCEDGDIQKLNQVINKITNINLKTSRGLNAIIIATLNGHIEIVKRLIQARADINSKSISGKTLLMYSLDFYVQVKDPSILLTLLNSGADVFLTDDLGNNFLDYVTKINCKDLLKYLY